MIIHTRHSFDTTTHPLYTVMTELIRLSLKVGLAKGAAHDFLRLLDSDSKIRIVYSWTEFDVAHQLEYYTQYPSPRGGVQINTQADRFAKLRKGA